MDGDNIHVFTVIYHILVLKVYFWNIFRRRLGTKRKLTATSVTKRYTTWPEVLPYRWHPIFIVMDGDNIHVNTVIYHIFV